MQNPRSGLRPSLLVIKGPHKGERHLCISRQNRENGQKYIKAGWLDGWLAYKLGSHERGLFSSRWLKSKPWLVSELGACFSESSMSTLLLYQGKYRTCTLPRGLTYCAVHCCRPRIFLKPKLGVPNFRHCVFMVYSPINGKYQEIHPCWRNSIKINSSLLVIIRVHKIHLMKGSGCSRKFKSDKKLVLAKK